MRASYRMRNTLGLINDFLAVQYGVRPLIRDVHGAIKLLHDKEKDGGAYHVDVEARAYEKLVRVWIMKDQSHGVEIPVSEEILTGCTVHLSYDMDEPLHRSLASWGITNPAETVWELTPLSFLLDWWLPVGDYLSAMDADFGWDFKTGSRTLLCKRHSVIGTPIAVNPNAMVIQGPTNPELDLSTSIDRKVYLVRPRPTVPRFKNPLSAEHTANAIALAVANAKLDQLPPK